MRVFGTHLLGIADGSPRFRHRAMDQLAPTALQDPKAFQMVTKPPTNLENPPKIYGFSPKSASEPLKKGGETINQADAKLRRS